MAAAAARRTGAPLPIRALAILLATVLSALPLLVLLYGLSVTTIEAIRSAPTVVELLPLPEPQPPPLPVPAETRPEKRTPALAAPASASPPPASAPDATIVAAPAPPPAPPRVAQGAGGSGAGSGNGDGIGGSGSDGGARPGPVLTPADWAVVPGDAEIMPFDPPRAFREQVNGDVLLKCNVLRSGRPTNCRVASERPRGYGFGKAAIAATRNFQLIPPTRDGEPDERAWVEIPVAFNHRRPRR
jgi:periplasmic protein TonB